MKNDGLRYGLVAILVVILVGLIGVLVMSTRNSSWFGFGGSTEIVKEQEFDLTDISRLTLNFVAGDVEIKYSDNDKLKVIQYSNQSRKNNLFDSKQSGKSLEIVEYERTQWFSFGFDFSKFEIYLPASYEGDMVIKNVSGSIDVYDYYQWNTAEVKSTSGKIHFYDEIISDQMNFKSVSGDIISSQLQTKNIELKTTSGKIEVEAVVGDVNASSVSGRIVMNQVVGKLNASTTSGKIEINQFTILNDSSLKSVSGKIKVHFSSDVNCRMEASSVSGNIEYPYNGTVLGTDPYYKLDVKTTSGKIELTQ